MSWCNKLDTTKENFHIRKTGVSYKKKYLAFLINIKKLYKKKNLALGKNKKDNLKLIEVSLITVKNTLAQLKCILRIDR